uniref:Uncharacterized protein n=1 Tax=Rhizophora mucronata TaxID=61149 RepID=A0A2P2NEH9_RHIMU
MHHFKVLTPCILIYSIHKLMTKRFVILLGRP